MNTILYSSVMSIQNNAIFASNFSDKAGNYAKIAAVALAIIGAVAALIYFYRHYEASALSSDDSDIPPHISPSHVHLSPDSKSHSKILPSPPDSPSLGHVPPAPPPPVKDKKNPKDKDAKDPLEEDDLEFAKRLQEQFLEGDLDDVESDEEIAKRLQAKYDNELSRPAPPDLFKPKPNLLVKKPLTPSPITPSPKITPVPDNSNSEDQPVVVVETKKEDLAVINEKPKPTKPSPFCSDRINFWRNRRKNIS